VRLALPVAPAQVPESTAAAPAALGARTLRILTRRPALAESLARHAAALGLTAVCDQGEQRIDAADAGELVVADASTHAGAIEAVFRAAPTGGAAATDRNVDTQRPPLVVVATAAQLESLRCRGRIDPEAIVSKPVHRAALHAALAKAAGLEPEPLAQPAAARPDAPLGGHVLLVEDEPVNAAVAQGYLAELGCTSVWVDSGAEAIARSAAERFDLIMMDLNMPAMDGFAATRLIRQRQGEANRVPIIALTAHEAKNYRDACLAAGMDDLLSKPYTLDQCAVLLRRWIRRERPETAVAGPSIALGTETAAEVDAGTVLALKSLRGQSDLYSKLVDLFRSGSARALEDLEAALDAHDFTAAASISHKLGSSAGNVGALAFARYVRRLEQLCSERDAAPASRIFQVVRAAHPALIEELDRLQLEKSA
jgi:two-component system, sensor histidine kinase and response regulator